MSHTGTAKHLCLSLSTRSMTAACGHIAAQIQQIKHRKMSSSLPLLALDSQVLYRRGDVGIQGQQLQNGLQKLWDPQTCIKIRHTSCYKNLLQHTHTHTHTETNIFIYSYMHLPSALISFGPQVQMEDAGKFASARTVKKTTT